MQAILMGLVKIRNMTDNTAASLKVLGVNADDMKAKMEDGSMTVFQALQIVAEAIDRNKGKVKEVGAVMQDVFGRQARTSGDNLGKAIANLNTNLEETKRQTGDVGNAYNDLYEANVKLEQALQKTFGYKGWEEMATGIKTKLVSAMANVLELAEKINTLLVNYTGKGYFDNVYESATRALGPLGTMLRLLKDINKEKGGDAGGGAAVGGAISGARNDSVSVIPEIVVYGNRKGNSGGKGSSTTIKTEEQLNNENIQKLTQEYIYASEQRQAAIRDEIKVLQERNSVIQQMKDEALGKVGPDRSGFTVIDTSAMKLPELSAVTIPIKFDIDTTGMTALEVLEAELENLKEQQQAFGGVSSEVWQHYKELINQAQAKIDEFKGKTPVKNLEEDADGTAKSFQKAAGAISSIGSAMQSIEDPTAKILGMIAEAIASIALGFSQAIGKDIGKSGNVWYGIAAAAAGVASMITTISAIHSATGYAQGGVIEGTHYSGDMQYARVNAGETILTRAQAGIIAGALEGGGLQNLRLSATISGEQIRLALNNNGRRTGRGEYVTTNFQRG